MKNGRGTYTWASGEVYDGGRIEAVSGSGFGTKMTVVLPGIVKTVADGESKDGSVIPSGGSTCKDIQAGE